MTTKAQRCRRLRDQIWRDLCYWSQPRFGLTFEAILTRRQNHYYDNPDYKKLRELDRLILEDRYVRLTHDLENQLCHTYVWEGRRYLAGYGPEKDVSARLIYEHGKSLEEAGMPSGCFCYAFAVPAAEGSPHRLALLPYREYDRQGELTTGRLSEEVLTNQSKIFLPKRNLRNGNQTLVAYQPLPIFGDGDVFCDPAVIQLL